MEPFNERCIMLRLAVVTPTPTPYRDPFWNIVGGTPGVELTVYYARRGDNQRPWDITWDQHFKAVYPRAVPVLPHGESYWNPRITQLLRRGRHEALLLGGYNHLTMLVAARFARRNRIPYYLMSEVYLAQPRSRWRRLVKGPVVRWVVRGARGWLPTGTLAAEYLVHYGADPERICFVPNVPDLDAIRAQADAIMPTRSAVRARLGWGDDPCILFVGRLLALKQVDTLIQAFARVASRMPAQLVIAGDGPKRQALECLARELNVAERVRFCGFVSPDALIPLYCAADLFVLPSSDETWGVVVLEALATGLPVIVSNMVGCHRDVVRSYEVGDVVPPCQVERLAAAIESRLKSCRRVPFDAWQAVYESMNYRAVASRLIQFISSTANGRQ